jgi:hypothetical protein
LKKVRSRFPIVWLQVTEPFINAGQQQQQHLAVDSFSIIAFPCISFANGFINTFLHRITTFSIFQLLLWFIEM